MDGTAFDQLEIRITDLFQSDGHALREARACDGWVSLKELDGTRAPHYRPLEVIRIQPHENKDGSFRLVRLARVGRRNRALTRPDRPALV